jgi:hypothetical protein
VLLTEKAGKWGRGVLAKAPKNAKSDYWKDAVDVFDISCGAPRECLAAGIYHGRRSVEHLTMLTEKAGGWHRGVEAALPRGAKRPYPSAVSYSSPGNCTVVGSYGNTDYLDGPGEHGFLLTESAGR